MKLWSPPEEVVSKAPGGTLWEENRPTVVTEQEKEKPSRMNHNRERSSSLSLVSEDNGSGDTPHSGCFGEPIKDQTPKDHEAVLALSSHYSGGNQGHSLEDSY